MSTLTITERLTRSEARKRALSIMRDRILPSTLYNLRDMHKDMLNRAYNMNLVITEYENILRENK